MRLSLIALVTILCFVCGCGPSARELRERTLSTLNTEADRWDGGKTFNTTATDAYGRPVAASVEKTTFHHVLEVRSNGPDGLPKNSDDITVTRTKPHGETTFTEEAAKATETPNPETDSGQFNVSALESADVSFPVVEDFESGDLTGWDKIKGLGVTSSAHYAGTYGAEAASTGAATYARRPIPDNGGDVYLQFRVKVVSQANNTVYLARFRTDADASILGIYITGAGKLGYRSDAAAQSVTSQITVSAGSWHLLQVHAHIGAGGHVEIWLDGGQTPIARAV